MEIRSLDPAHAPWAAAVLTEHFGSPRSVSRGRLHDTADLPALVAMAEGRPAGVVHYRIEADECEVVTLVATPPGRGAGTALLAAVCACAREAGCRRIWLVTTNDNRRAQAFYAARGWRRVAVYPGSIREARRLKPEIPLFGEDGTPIEDEIEFEIILA